MNINAYATLVESLNPPIRGSIDVEVECKGNELGLNPPIRGSIEQDNALFENYNHKR